MPSALSLDGCHLCRPNGYPMHALYAHVVSSGLRPEGLQAWFSVTVHAAGQHVATENESGEDSAESLQDFEQGDIFFQVPVSDFMFSKHLARSRNSP